MQGRITFFRNRTLSAVRAASLVAVLLFIVIFSQAGSGESVSLDVSDIVEGYSISEEGTADGLAVEKACSLSRALKETVEKQYGLRVKEITVAEGTLHVKAKPEALEIIRDVLRQLREDMHVSGNNIGNK